MPIYSWFSYFGVALILVFTHDALFSEMNFYPETNRAPASTAPTSVAPSPRVEEYVSPAAKNAKANAEILHEMFEVIYIREPQDHAEFGNWVDTLNQGASLEGVYHGLIQTQDYRKLESLYKGASPGALRVFAEEFTNLEENTANRDATLSKLTNQYLGISVYTLKRVLGDEALRVISTKTAYREMLALWYSKWVVRIGQRNIDFGIPLRNNLDEDFHFKWALENSLDRLQWEVLNRIHRVLNEENRQTQ